MNGGMLRSQLPRVIIHEGMHVRVLSVAFLIAGAATSQSHISQ